MDRLPGKKAKITESIDNVKKNMLALNQEIIRRTFVGANLLDVT